MACSTAADSNMRIIYNSSEPDSLQMNCLEILRPVERDYLCAAFPGIQHIFKSVFADILQKPYSKFKEFYNFIFRENKFDFLNN